MLLSLKLHYFEAIPLSIAQKQLGLIRADEQPGFRHVRVSARAERVHPCLSLFGQRILQHSRKKPSDGGL